MHVRGLMRQHLLNHLMTHCVCRLKTMELMSKEGWSPSIDLWEESGTIFVNIHKVDFEILIGQHDPQRELQTENSFSMYYTDYVGAELVLAQIVQGQHSRPPIKVQSDSHRSTNLRPLYGVLWYLTMLRVGDFGSCLRLVALWHWCLPACVD